MAGGAGQMRARWPSFGLARPGRDRGRVLSPNVARMGAAILALIVMAVAAGTGYVYQLRASAAVQHTVEVDGALARIYSTVQDAETGQRGFLLTGDESFLQPTPGPRAGSPSASPPFASWWPTTSVSSQMSRSSKRW